MTIEEFKSRLTDNSAYISSTDWKVITKVYAFHPAISETRGKEQIAKLYNSLGMGVIVSMYAEAEAWEKVEDEYKRLAGVISESMDALRLITTNKTEIEQRWRL